MKIDEIKEVVQMAVGGAEEIKPIIRNVIKAIEEYAPELEEPIGKLRDYIVDAHIKIITRLEKQGFARGDAIVIAGNVTQSMKRVGSK